MFLPCDVFRKAAMIFWYGSCGVEYATRASCAAGSDAPDDVLGAVPAAPPHASVIRRPAAPTASAATEDRRGRLADRCTRAPSESLVPPARSSSHERRMNGERELHRGRRTSSTDPASVR